MISSDLDSTGLRQLRTVSSNCVDRERVGVSNRFQVTGSKTSADVVLQIIDDVTLKDDADSYISNRSVHFSIGHALDVNKTDCATVRNEESNMANLDKDDTSNCNKFKSWRYMRTIEHPPIIDFYRNTLDTRGGLNSRPSMNQLIHGDSVNADTNFDEFKVNMDTMPSSPKRIERKISDTSKRNKFGWIQGVFVRCILNIFGVMLYLRVGWVAGQAGVVLGTFVVILASIVTTITALSTCAICTNGDVKGGGAYFLISRSLGPEFGGSIGLIFSVANAVGAAMYIVGFSETVRDLMRVHGVMIIDSGMNDVRVIGCISCAILMAIVLIGSEFESKMQMGLLVILVLSLINYFIGSFLSITPEQTFKGITGFSFGTMTENLLPAFRGGENFFSVFAVYFPAATGIMAGANISGDLADPQQAIPKGTLLAILVTSITYVIIVWMTGSTCVRDADGYLPPLFLNGTYVQPDCAFNSTCPYGLMNYFQVIESESLWGPLITAGIFAATLSSALASLVSAPKIFQAVCKDRLFPKVQTFSKGYGKNDEPRRAYILAFVITLIMILIGELNAIAPIISNFFLASYALINYSCFDASFADSPGFRPSFKYYNMWVSLIGAVLCISVMFIISWVTALVTFFFFAVIFLYILHRKPDVNWGSSTQAHSYKNALIAVQKLGNTEEHVKNYRPQILVLTGNPAARASLVDFVYNITRGTSLMICGYIIPYPPCGPIFGLLQRMDRQMSEWFKKRRVKSFYVSVANPSLRAGAQNLVQLAGLGKLRPNILIIGFKGNWHQRGQSGLEEINDYFGVIQDAFESDLGVAVFRNTGSGLDYSELMKRHNVGDTARLNLPDVNQCMQPKSSFDQSRIDGSEISKEEIQQKMRQIGRQKAVETVSSTANTLDAVDLKNFCEMNEAYLKDNMLIRLAALSSYLVNCPLESFDDDEKASSASGSENDEIYQVEMLEKDNTESDRDHLPTDALLQSSASKAIRESSSETKVETIVSRHQSLYDHLGMIKSRYKTKKNWRKGDQQGEGTRRPTSAQRELVATISRFQKRVKHASIDVWWLYDDGGLTLLIPHLLTLPKRYLEGSHMRVFTISTSTDTMEQEQRNLAALLAKFRINFSDVFVIPDIGKPAGAKVHEAFSDLVSQFRVPDCTDLKGLITDSELGAQEEKTNRQLRIAELLHEYSENADLIVLTLPVPRKRLISSCLYMAWLDIMTRNLPPTLMIRGNQKSVLTFYS